MTGLLTNEAICTLIPGSISIPAVFLRRVTVILNNAIFLGFYWLMHFVVSSWRKPKKRGMNASVSHSTKSKALVNPKLSKIRKRNPCLCWQ